MWVFPMAAAGLSFAFAGSLLRRWAVRRRGFQLVWVVALFMYGIAALAMAIGVISPPWSELTYRLFWLFGAVLNVPYLAQGELMLVARRAWLIRFFLVILLLGTAVAAWLVFTSDIHPEALGRSLPLGKEAFGAGTAAHRAAFVSYVAYLYLVVASIWSAMRMRGHPELRNRAGGAVCIAVGATVVAVGSGVGAGLNVPWLFSVCLAVGVAVMYWGFLLAGRPVAAREGQADAG